MKGKQEKDLLIWIDDAWVERQDMDCLFNDTISMFNMLLQVIDVHAENMVIFYLIN